MFVPGQTDRQTLGFLLIDSLLTENQRGFSYTNIKCRWSSFLTNDVGAVC